MKRTLLFVLFCYACLVSLRAQISITTDNTSYSQNFDSLNSSGTTNLGTGGAIPSLTGWFSNRTDYTANNGGSNTVGLYSYGATTIPNSKDRALGQIVGSGTPRRVFFGIRFKNNTGSAIKCVFVQYTGEQWRTASSTAATLDFSYFITTGSIDITSDQFIPYDELDFVSVVNNNNASALDGNNSNNRIVKNSVIILPTPLANNEELFLRYALPNNPAQHGLAIDDLNVTFGVNNNLHIPSGTVLQNLNVNGFDVTLDGPLNITKSLTLTQGVISTTATNLLILNDNLPQPTASNNSYVNGPVKKIGDDAFVFPVGKNGKYVPIAISAPGNIGDAFTAEYFPSSAAALGPVNSPATANSPALLKVSSCEYWNLERTTGSSNVDVTLSWNSNNACSGPGYISDPPSIVVAHFNGSSWNAHGGTVTGTITSGSVTWSGVSQFSPFTFGTTSVFNVLPVHFSNVKATEQAAGIQIGFTNMTESEIDYYEIERSKNGQPFNAVKRIRPEKNDNGAASYTYLDATASEGKNAYRIKAVETTGKTIYSDVVNITLGVRSRSLSVYAMGGHAHVQVYNLPAGKYQFKVYSAAGQLINVENIDHAGGSLSQVTLINNAKAGVYIYSINGPVQMQKRFVVQ